MEWLRKGRKAFAEQLQVIRPYIDDAFYVSDCQRREVEPPQGDLAAHYLEVGARSGVDPSPNFSTTAYLSDYPDIAEVGLNPLFHYLAYGRHEGRRPKLAADAREVLDILSIADELETRVSTPRKAMRRRRAPIVDEVGRIAPVPLSERPRSSDMEIRNWAFEASLMVDDDFYRGMYPDLLLEAGESSDHFMTSGWTLGLDPNYWFDTSFYLETNPDVAESGANPLVHYLSQGRYEGRMPRLSQLGERNFILSQRAIEVQAKEWIRPELPIFQDVQEVVAKMQRGSSARTGANADAGLVIQVASDDPASATGGVQLCVQVEGQGLRARGIDVLHLRPFQPLPILSPPSSRDVALVATLNGRELPGAIRTTDVAALVSQIKSTSADSSAHVSVHGMLGHSPELLGQQLGKTTLGRSVIWLHDYFSLCASPQLAFDGLAFCSAPPPDSGSCSICSYGGQRSSQEDRLWEFAKGLRATMVSPSAAAVAVFSASARHKWGPIDVVPHGVLRSKGGRGRSSVAEDRPVCVAFVGHGAPHKGVFTFERLQRALASGGEVRLRSFGVEPLIIPGVAHSRVRQSAGNLGAMTSALVRNGVDAVLIWPTWPETFSFVVHEAIAAGCLVITHPNSGNVAPLAAEYGRALLFENEELLLDAALSGSLAKTIRAQTSEEMETFEFEFTGLMSSLVDTRRH